MGRKAKEKETMRAEVAAEIADIVAVYPRYELRLFYEHRTMDMSVGGGYSSDMIIPLSEIRKGETLNTDVLGCGRIVVADVSEERLVLNWCSTDYEVNLDTSVKTRSYAVDNPYLSYEEVYLRFEYKYVSVEVILSETFDRITEYHSRMKRPAYPETARQQMLALGLLKELCKHDVEWYVPLAVLSAADNWADVRLARPYIFRNLLFEGVRHGALSPDNKFAWHWIEIAARENDPAEFMDDRQRFCDLLRRAAEAGNEEASQILETLSDNDNKLIKEDEHEACTPDAPQTV